MGLTSSSSPKCLSSTTQKDCRSGGLSKLTAQKQKKKVLKIVMVGLENGGKTTILRQLDLLGHVPQSPNKISAIKSRRRQDTTGDGNANDEMVETMTMDYKGVHLTFQTVRGGGEEKSRPDWFTYFHDMQGLIFVVDSTNRDLLVDSVRYQLWHIMCHADLHKVALLVWANKQDLPGAMGPREVRAKLQLHRFAEGRRWHIQPCSAFTTEGLHEGLDCLVDFHFLSKDSQSNQFF